MENPASKPNLTGSFMGGFFNGAKSGAMMMGIFSSLYFVAALLPIPGNPVHFSLIASLATATLGTISTGIFSGINAVGKANTEAHSARHASHLAERGPVRAPEHHIAPEQAVAEAHARSTNWAERTGKTHGDNIQDILSRGGHSASHTESLTTEAGRGDLATQR
jgi:hypothetical protein